LLRSNRPDASFLCREATRFLDRWLAPTDFGFQWGSGPSTLWLARRIHHLTTAEHHAVRARKTQAQLRAEGLDDKVALYLARNAQSNYHARHEYVGTIDAVPDHSLDVCLIDGPARLECCLASVLKLKSGGLLVLHHADLYLAHTPELTAKLPKWDHVAWSLGPWRQIWTTDGSVETAIFIKP
jgi:hypothetical protein